MILELLFVLYLISGPIKSFIAYFRLPVPLDFTVAICLLLFGCYGSLLALGKQVPRFAGRQLFPMMLLISLLLWMASTLSFTPSASYSGTKVFNFVTVVLAFVMGVSLPRINVERVLLINYTIAFIMGLVFIWTLHANYIVNWTASFRKFNANYLNLAEHLGVTILALLYSPQILARQQVLKVLLVVVGVGNVLLMGGRGPLLFIVGFGLLRLIKEAHSLIARVGPKTALRGAGIMVMTVVLISVVTLANRRVVFSTLNRTVERFSLLMPGAKGDGKLGDSAQARISMLHDSIELISSNPESFIFGHGVGSYGILTTGVDRKEFPHNIFLETNVELGFLGTSLLLLFFASVLLQTSSSKMLSRILIVFLILNALKSHNITDLRLMFGLMGLYLGGARQFFPVEISASPQPHFAQAVA